MKIPSLFLTLSAVALTAASAFGDTYSFSGSTGGALTFNRPTEPGDLLSDIGTEAPYYLQPFAVTLSGNYDFTLQPVDPSGYDSFLHLYSGAFNSSAPLVNFLAANDDAPGGVKYGSMLTGISLTAGTTYFFVADGFSNADAGAFNAQISGPGSINPVAVPEPVSGALAGLGVAAMLILRRRNAR